MLKVTFVNFELGYDSGMQTLVGNAGQYYGGPSYWSPEHGCQSIVTTFPDKRAFRLALEQIARGFSLYGRRWSVVEIEEVKDVAEVKPEPEPVIVPTLSVTEIDKQREATKPKPNPKQKPKSKPAPKPEEVVVHDRLPAATLKDIAKRQKIDIQGLVTRSEIAAYINLALEERALGAVPA